jgi:EAL domain-containing protein (putative c-di-GMP-specific phosphodiesterase class I)
LAVTLNINFLPTAVYQPEACIQATLRVAERTGFPLNRITFEIVEQEDLIDPGHLLRIVSAYKAFGFKVALDDFGAGYSGLSRLAELKPDIVKIDRALMALKMPRNLKHCAAPACVSCKASTSRGRRSKRSLAPAPSHGRNPCRPELA